MLSSSWEIVVEMGGSNAGRVEISPTIGKTRAQQTWNQKGHHKQRFSYHLFVVEFQVAATVLHPTQICLFPKQFLFDTGNSTSLFLFKK